MLVTGPKFDVGTGRGFLKAAGENHEGTAPSFGSIYRLQ